MSFNVLAGEGRGSSLFCLNCDIISDLLKPRGVFCNRLLVGVPPTLLAELLVLVDVSAGSKENDLAFDLGAGPRPPELAEMWRPFSEASCRFEATET